MEFVSYYTRPDDQSLVGALDVFDDGLTKQEFREECDINHIMARYAQFGTLPVSNEQAPMYGDFTDVATLMDAHAVVQQASDLFAALPAKVRDRFANDPVRMVEFLNDPANRDEALKLGMLQEPVVAEPVAVVQKAGDVIKKKKVEKSPKVE